MSRGDAAESGTRAKRKRNCEICVYPRTRASGRRGGIWMCDGHNRAFAVFQAMLAELRGAS